MTTIDPVLLPLLRCPVTNQPLEEDASGLLTADGQRRYDIVDGIPCLMPPVTEATHDGYTQLQALNAKAGEGALTRDQIDDFLDRFAAATCGNLFVGLKFRDRMPIPDFPPFLSPGRTLDIGCNWGRWSFAGALAGHRMVGMDINLSSLRVARALAERFTPGNIPHFVLGDARTLPFARDAFDNVFSYSVVQHFSRANAAKIAAEVGRVLRPGGRSAIQMPNRDGLKALLTMPRRRFAEGEQFAVRYYAIEALIEMFESGVGPSEWAIDCYLGLNVHAKDRDIIPRSKRWIIDLAEALKAAAGVVPPLGRLSDSVWVNSHAR
jgi:SAM-dependent methyltransferase/uncharacterized protein YbaR (Trm112 family)